MKEYIKQKQQQQKTINTVFLAEIIWGPRPKLELRI